MHAGNVGRVINVSTALMLLKGKCRRETVEGEQLNEYMCEAVHAGNSVCVIVRLFGLFLVSVREN